MGDSTGTHVGMPGQTTTPGNGDDDSEQGNPQYIAFVLVPVFFLLGLLGVVVCHVLKRKGYRCTTEEEEEGKDLEQGGELSDTLSESNNDTVGQIVRYIMKNEANSDALKAMVHENSIDSDGPVTPTSPSPPLTPVSPDAPPGLVPPGVAKHTCNHLHTIGGAGGPSNTCNRCSHKRGWPLTRRPLTRAPSARKAERRSQGEVTVLAVGRFRVTKCEKPAKERRTLLVTDSNGSAPTSPTEAGPEPNGDTLTWPTEAGPESGTNGDALTWPKEAGPESGPFLEAQQEQADNTK